MDKETKNFLIFSGIVGGGFIIFTIGTKRYSLLIGVVACVILALIYVYRCKKTKRKPYFP
jgi:hypothetical protein